MNQLINPLLGALLLFTPGFISAAPQTNQSIEKVYGKIIAVNHNSKTLTVQNNRKNIEYNLKWDNETKIVQSKKPFAPSDLSIGQNLIVYKYEDPTGTKLKQITVRQPRN